MYDYWYVLKFRGIRIRFVHRYDYLWKLQSCAGLCRACFAAFSLALSLATFAEDSVHSVYLEDLTWTEVQQRLNNHSTTVIVPIGGTEQSGPYLVLGKHNIRVHALAGQIARKLGNALVAPVIAYVPEGSIHPASGHMRFPGTISIPPETFESVLDATARSFKEHGFRDVVFIGDHGGYQKNEEKVATRLNLEWGRDPSCRVHAITQYYRVTQQGYVSELKKQGFTRAEIGEHAGLADTSLSLAIDPGLVRQKELEHSAVPVAGDGIDGDPRRSTVNLGQLGIEQIVAASVTAIRSAVAAQR